MRIRAGVVRPAHSSVSRGERAKKLDTIFSICLSSSFSTSSGVNRESWSARSLNSVVKCVVLTTLFKKSEGHDDLPKSHVRLYGLAPSFSRRSRTALTSSAFEEATYTRSCWKSTRTANWLRSRMAVAVTLSSTPFFSSLTRNLKGRSNSSWEICSFFELGSVGSSYSLLTTQNPYLLLPSDRSASAPTYLRLSLMRDRSSKRGGTRLSASGAPGPSRPSL